jgi:hypothetical protein
VASAAAETGTAEKAAEILIFLGPIDPATEPTSVSGVGVEGRAQSPGLPIPDAARRNCIDVSGIFCYLRMYWQTLFFSFIFARS